MIYIVHYNHDYNESMKSSFDLAEICRDIRDALEIEDYINGDDLADEIQDSYNSGEWKGLALYAIDPVTAQSVTLDIREAINSLLSNHASLAFFDKIKQEMSKAA